MSVDGNNDFAYVAGSVTETTVREFTYKIADANGESNTATITANVQNVGELPSNAVCYVLTGSTTQVSSLTALETAITNASPGDRIQVQAGTYSSGTTNINNNGTESNPIVIEPQGAIGSVTFTGVTFSWNTTSSRIVFRGSNHNGGRHNMRGSHNRIDLCQFRQIREAIWVLGAINSRVSRCDFADFVNAIVTNRCIYFDPNFLVSGATANFLIDWNYIHDINPTATGSGNQSHEMITSFSQLETFDLPIPTVIVDHNRFQNISTPNESELISMKWGGGIWRFNTHINLSERVTFRRCASWEVRSNWFDACSIPMETYGPNHLVIANRFGSGTNGTVRINMGNTFPDDNSGYITCEALQFRNNVGGTYLWGFNNGHGANDTPMINCNHFGNTGHLQLQPGGHTGTTNVNPGLAFTPAVELLATQVGRNAADPLCA